MYKVKHRMTCTREVAFDGVKGSLNLFVPSGVIDRVFTTDNQSATVVTRGYKGCDLSHENFPCEIRLNGWVVKSFSRLKRTIERVSSSGQRD